MIYTEATTEKCVDGCSTIYCEGLGTSRIISYHEAIPPTCAFDIENLVRYSMTWQEMAHQLHAVVGINGLMH